MKRSIIAAILVLSLCLCLAGCGGGSVDLMKGVEPGNADSTAIDMRPELARFYVNLFQHSLSNGENVLISPMSVLNALAMTGNGAAGETRAQMEEVMGHILSLNGHVYSATQSALEGKELSLANAIWFRDDGSFSVNEDFLQTNATFYGAGIYKAPFDDNTLREVNDWAKENTKGMIPEVLNSLPEDAVMLLVNALVFEAEWENPYRENQIREGVFCTEDGSAVKVDYLHGAEDMYLEDSLATGFIKLYEGGRYGFAALLPNEGISVAEYVASLNGAELLTMLQNPRTDDIEYVRTKMPAFELCYECELSEVLSGMGMGDAFDPAKADFSGMGRSDMGNIYLSSVFHKTYINVSATGTEAAAVTTVVSTPSSAPAVTLEIKEVYLERPFVYMLIDMETGLPFFMGVMMEPGE